MANKKIVHLNSEEIKQLGTTLAVAKIAAESPKERNPRIPMKEDALFRSALKNGLAKYNLLKSNRKKFVDKPTI